MFPSQGYKGEFFKGLRVPALLTRIRGSVNELMVMIDELILSIQESSRAVPAKFAEVGHRVNLMALKGEIILSDVTFDDEG